MEREELNHYAQSTLSQFLKHLQSEHPEATLTDVIHFVVLQGLALADLAEANIEDDDFDGGEIIEHIVADLNGTLEQRALAEEYNEDEEISLEIVDHHLEQLRETLKQDRLDGNQERIARGEALIKEGEQIREELLAGDGDETERKLNILVIGLDNLDD